MRKRKGLAFPVPRTILLASLLIEGAPETGLSGDFRTLLLMYLYVS